MSARRRSLLLLATFCLAASTASARTVRLGNPFLERAFTIEDGRLRTVSLLNKRDHRLYPVNSDEFRLQIVWERIGYRHGDENPVALTAADFRLDDLDEKPGRLAFRLACPRFGLEVTLVYSLADQDFYLRKWLEVRSTGDAPVFVEQVAVENLTLPGTRPHLGGFGQPLYADNLFLGLEYPGGYNAAERGRIRLWYYVGQTTGREVLRTEAAVIGAAPDGAVRESFFEYVSRIRTGPVRPTIVFNTWYDMQRDTLTEANSLDRLALLKKKLLDPYGIRLSSFVLDDGWDDRNTVWDVHARRFPSGLGPLSEALARNGTALGLWFGPIGGYEQRALRIAAGRKQGYEITANGQYFCLAGPKYRQKFKSTVLEMVRKYSVNHLKFDGVPYGCNAPDHGHLMGVYSREAHLRAFIDLLRAVRAADPRVFLNITTSNWLSPWWLQYADVVFMGGMDYGFLNNVPAAAERDKAITYRDSVLYDDFRRYEYQFPNSSLMTIGIIKGTLGAEGGLGESEASWLRNAIMNFSRGSMLSELYVSPAILKDAEWRSLAATIRWADRNRDVLLGDTRSVLGDPAKREVYGYAHFRGRGIVTLRNPSVEEQTVSLRLDGSLGLKDGPETFRMRVIYPYAELRPGTLGYGDTARLTLAGYEVLVLEFVPQGSLADRPPEGVRYEVQPDGKYRVYPGRAAAPPVEYRLSGEGGALTIEMPRGSANRRLGLLYEMEKEGAVPSLVLKINGQDVKAQVISPGSSEQGLGAGGGQWTFVLAPLAEGTNRIEFRGQPKARGKLSAWLLADFRLEGRTLSEAAAAAPREDSLPASSGIDSRVIHLFTREISAP
ncbi:MAG TPA: hypothetical protein VFA33_03450 [Bryobacteraceae bacterium]|nr:hypothetical protein [Bryobacteraceae bacterium]